VKNEHEDVNEKVEGDNDPGNGSATVELGVAEDGGGGVVEDVEELKGLLLDDKEDRVEELPVCKAEEKGQDA
jgi:hypothetical protein